MAISGGQYGTVSSTLLALSRKPQHSIYQYAPGPPCDCAYDDLSALLRQVLSAGRRQKAGAVNGEKSRHEKAKVKVKAKRALTKKPVGETVAVQRAPVFLLPPEKAVRAMSREFPNCLLGSMSDECHQLDKEARAARAMSIGKRIKRPLRGWRPEMPKELWYRR